VTVVTALRSSWFSVTLTLLLMGVLAATSRLPQYLMHAMFEGAECVRWTTSVDEDASAAAPAADEDEDIRGGEARGVRRAARGARREVAGERAAAGGGARGVGEVGEPTQLDWRGC
jgi:hypothetical protein